MVCGTPHPTAVSAPYTRRLAVILASTCRSSSEGLELTHTSSLRQSELDIRKAQLERSACQLCGLLRTFLEVSARV